jgi:cytochrome c biogenesis protein
MAVILLVLLALAVVAGVFLPQQGLVEAQQIKAQYGQHYLWMKCLGLFDVFNSPWFIALEALFFFNVLFGSFVWLKPAWNAATKQSFCGPEHILASPDHLAPLPSRLDAETLLTRTQATLKRFGYRVWRQGNRLYATKGQWGRLGPCVAHVGILATLLAALFGAFTTFKAQKIAAPGETFTIPQSEMFVTSTPRPYWFGSIPDVRIRVKDFRIEFYDRLPATVRQYFCDLELLDATGKNVLKRQTISVNHPLNLGDLTIYQASFAPTGRLFVRINGKPQAILADQTLNDQPMAVVPLNDAAQRSLIIVPMLAQQGGMILKNHLVAFLHTPQGFAGAGPGRMPDNIRVHEGETKTLHGVQLGFERPEVATGLQIKQSPEVAWIYLAYVILGAGVCLSFIAQRQLWLAVRPAPTTQGAHELLIQFRAKKARVSFQQELLRLDAALRETLASPVAAESAVSEKLSPLEASASVPVAAVVDGSVA